MKSLCVVSFGEQTGVSIRCQLEEIFKGDVEVKCVDVRCVLLYELDCDLVLFSSDEVLKIFSESYELDFDYVVLRRVIRHECIDDILKVKDGKDVLVVNDTKESCLIVREQLKNHGIEHVLYYPYYPGVLDYKKTDIAITPGESHLVPDGVKSIIDIKSRKMDITSLIEIMMKLDYMDKYGHFVSSYFYRDMINVSKKYINMSHESSRLKDVLSEVLDNQKKGISYSDEEKIIIHKIDDELRKKDKVKDNFAKYTFDDIIGVCESLKKNIALSKKVAKKNATVLIQGETGTGKEVLAQAIHNESDRCDYPFVAINFAAMSENLIESELFGYEEGAFTGAKKGGKEGLFKKAHKGTIFLDEIGDASLYIQSRLLRVLQEREVTPVGSTETIPIDIRVIAATNRDLQEEVKNKKFREDLYYRLNVMPIYSIPLRERREDIRLLLSYYLNKIAKVSNLELFFTKDSINLLESYNWPGNIRELVNIVEYVFAIKEDEQKISTNDLPRYILDSRDFSEDLRNEKYERLSEEYSQNDELDNKDLWVLEKIYKYEGVGRRTLSIISYEENMNIGESKIRTIMKKLKESGFIEINKGLKGTKVLDKGIKWVNK
ncbi:MAG: sigma-54 interaction domain-containing protein [Peptostreptococcaceae bacterium]